MIDDEQQRERPIGEISSADESGEGRNGGDRLANYARWRRGDLDTSTERLGALIERLEATDGVPPRVIERLRRLLDRHILLSRLEARFAPGPSEIGELGVASRCGWLRLRANRADAQPFRHDRRYLRPVLPTGERRSPGNHFFSGRGGAIGGSAAEWNSPLRCALIDVAAAFGPDGTSDFMQRSEDHVKVSGTGLPNHRSFEAQVTYDPRIYATLLWE